MSPCKISSPAAGKINGGRYQHATWMCIVCTCTWRVFELFKSSFLPVARRAQAQALLVAVLGALPQAHMRDCFGSLRPQLLHIAAGSESSSDDSERLFLRSSFCKGLYYSFVEALEYPLVVCHQISMLSRRVDYGLVQEPPQRIPELKNKENCDLGSQNPQNFLACGAASRSHGLWRSEISFSAKCYALW